jgi:hypothetical protein
MERCYVVTTKIYGKEVSETYVALSKKAAAFRFRSDYPHLCHNRHFAPRVEEVIDDDLLSGNSTR